MSKKNASQQSSPLDQIAALQPSGAVGYKVFVGSRSHPTKDDFGRSYFLTTEYPYGVPPGVHHLLFIDAKGTPIASNPPLVLRMGFAAGVPAYEEEDDENDTEEDDDKENAGSKGEKAETAGQESDEDKSGEDGDSDQQKAKQKRASMRELDDLLIDETLGELLSESKAIKRKRERAKLSKHLGDVGQIANYYELFDHMKTDMTRQLLTVSKVNSRTTDIQLKLIDRLSDALNKNAQQQTQIIEKDNWATLASEALRTLSDLGKTAMTSRAVLLAEARPSLPALPSKAEDTKSEAQKDAAEAKEIAKKTERMLLDLIEMLKARSPADTGTKPRDEPKPVEPAHKAATPDAPPPPPSEKHAPTDQTAPPTDQKQAKEPQNKNDSDDPPPPAGATGSAASASVGSASKESSPNACKSVALARHPDPFVRSWRSIKSLFRRMTDTDFFAFTSSTMMFRGFLSMLRALTPYYKGPSVSLDDLVGAMA